MCQISSQVIQTSIVFVIPLLFFFPWVSRENEGKKENGKILKYTGKKITCNLSI